MDLQLKKNSGFTLFHPHDLTFHPSDKVYALVTNYDGWGEQYRDHDGLTGIHHEGAPKLFATSTAAKDAADQITATGNEYLFGIYEGGKQGRGALIHNLTPPIVDTVEGYADAGSW